MRGNTWNTLKQWGETHETHPETVRGNTWNTSWNSEGKHMKHILKQWGETHETHPETVRGNTWNTPWNSEGKHMKHTLKQWGETRETHPETVRGNTWNTPWNSEGKHMKHTLKQWGENSMKHILKQWGETQETHPETVRDKQHESHPEASRTGHNTNVTSYDRDVWNGRPVVAMDLSTRPTRSPISTNQIRNAAIFSTDFCLTRWYHKQPGTLWLSVVLSFLVQPPNTAKWL